MNLCELRVGSLVKYKDKVCTIENINCTNNTIYMKYSNEYFCSAKLEELEPIEIDNILLSDAGFIEIFPGFFKLAGKDYIFGIEMKEDYYELTIKDNNSVPVVFAAINYYHQLQMICGVYED